MNRPSPALVRRLHPLLFLLLAVGSGLPLFAESPGDGLTAAADWPPTGRQLPAELENDRWLLDLTTAEGEPLRLYTDTGGGMVMSRAGAERLGLLTDTVDGEDGDADGARVELPALDAATWIPDPPSLWVPPADQSPGFMPDGMLGASWFDGRRWTFDYDAGRLLFHEEPVTVPEALAGRTVELGFQRDEDGATTTGFPRITTVVDGEPLELLFDTGANSTYPPVFQTGDEWHAVSFITRSTADAWRAAHPDWTVVAVDGDGVAAAGDELADGYFIQVPELRLAGVEDLLLGDVWFVTRPDANFHDYMSRWMDRRVDGALGGNALAGLQVTVDYPAARATFVRPGSDPGRARLVSEDLERFWAAFDAAAAVDGDVEKAAEIYQRLYLDPASPGLQDFVESRISSAAELAAVVEADRPYYAAVRPQLRLDAEREAAIRGAFQRLAEIYPEAIFPPTYFVVGRLNSGGTTSPDALLIGMEIYALADDTPAEVIPERARNMVKPAVNLPHIVAHELIHAQQRRRGSQGLLHMALREGGADFLADLVLDAANDDGAWEPNYRSWGKAHAERVRQRFLADREGGSPEVSTWFYNYSQDDPEWHPDLGYFVGWEIARRYYAAADDKKAAVRELIRLTDPEAILAASGYSAAGAEAEPGADD